MADPTFDHTLSDGTTVTNDQDTAHTLHGRVVTGDITQRVKDTFIPDFYRGDPKYQCLVDFLEIVAPSFDYLLEHGKALPFLTQIERCPPEFLPHLGAMVGWHWDPTLDVGIQRRSIEQLVKQHHTKGTIPGIERIVRKRGAQYVKVNILSERLFTTSVSTTSGPDRIPDALTFRYGSYEIVTDIPRSAFEDDLLRYAHPAGTRYRVARTSIGDPIDNPRDIVTPGDEDLDLDFKVSVSVYVFIHLLEENHQTDDSVPEVTIIHALITQPPQVPDPNSSDTDPLSPEVHFQITTQPA